MVTYVWYNMKYFTVTFLLDFRTDIMYTLYCANSLLTCHVFPGSLTLGEVRAALWGARYEWIDLGLALGIPHSTIQVIEGHAVSQYSQINDVPRLFKVVHGYF